MTDPVQKWCDEVNQKESDGELTFKEAPINTYLQLTTDSKCVSCHVGRIVLKTVRFAEIDGEDITCFADTLTWIMVKDIEDCIVVRVSPTFHGGVIKPDVLDNSKVSFATVEIYLDSLSTSGIKRDL